METTQVFYYGGHCMARICGQVISASHDSIIYVLKILIEGTLLLIMDLYFIKGACIYMCVFGVLGSRFIPLRGITSGGSQ